MSLLATYRALSAQCAHYWLCVSFRINFLEEQIRDIEVHSETKRKEDEVRFQESMARIEREKLQELEKCINKICSLQREIEAANAEIKRHLLTIDRLQYVKDQLEDQIQDKNGEIESLKNEVNKLKEVIRVQNEESNANSSIIAALNNELSIRKPSDSSESKAYQTTEQDEMMNSISNEFEQQMRFLKEENRSLKEANEELTAQLLNNHLIEGKSLLKEGEAVSSLANEISDLNNEQVTLFSRSFTLFHPHCFFPYSLKARSKNNRMLMQNYAPTSMVSCWTLWKTIHNFLKWNHADHLCDISPVFLTFNVALLCDPSACTNSAHIPPSSIYFQYFDSLLSNITWLKLSFVQRISKIVEIKKFCLHVDTLPFIKDRSSHVTNGTWFFFSTCFPILICPSFATLILQIRLIAMLNR